MFEQASTFLDWQSRCLTGQSFKRQPNPVPALSHSPDSRMGNRWTSVSLRPELHGPLGLAVCLLLKRAGAPDSKSIDQS